jgi:hypothetical protein
MRARSTAAGDDPINESTRLASPAPADGNGSPQLIQAAGVPPNASAIRDSISRRHADMRGAAAR